MQDHEAITLLLLDDHDAARGALAARLAKTAGVLLVGETADPCEAARIVAEKRPDAALVDPRRQDGRGLSAITMVSRAADGGHTVVAVHTSYYDAEEWQRAREAGARDWLLKQPDIGALVSRIRDLVGRRNPGRQ